MMRAMKDVLVVFLFAAGGAAVAYAVARIARVANDRFIDLVIELTILGLAAGATYVIRDRYGRR